MKWSTLMKNDQDWQFVKMLGKPFLGSSKYTFNGGGVTVGVNSAISLNGTVSSAEGTTKEFTMDLKKDNGIWKVAKFGFKISP